MTRAARHPRHRSPITFARALVDVALIAVIGIGLGGVVLGRVLPALGHPVYVVAGPSMAPAIGVGAAVVLESVEPSALAVGDVVTLRSGPTRAVFTHRIIRLAERDGSVWIETKGDANDNPDPSITQATAVVGRVTTALPWAGYVLTLLSTPAGVALILSVGATLMVLNWYLESVERDRRRRRMAVGVPAKTPVPVPAQVPLTTAAPTTPVTTVAPPLPGPSTPVTTVAPPLPGPSRARARRAERRAARLTADTIASERRRLTRTRAVSRGT